MSKAPGAVHSLRERCCNSAGRTEPMASTAALIHWFEYSTKILPFLEGVAAINLAAEGQVAGAFGGIQQEADASSR